MLARTVADCDKTVGGLGGTTQRHQTADATRKTVSKLDQLIDEQRRITEQVHAILAAQPPQAAVAGHLGGS
jgi:hypothetical protein